MNTLYEKSNKKESILLESKKSLEKLSIEYNPLNSIKKDLGLVTYKEELDLKNTKAFVETQMLKQKFADRRVVDAEDILEYCITNSYTIRAVRNYRSELSDKCLESIQNFAKDAGINIANYKDNFFILAPRKYFEKENMDLGNIAFNIYYRDGYTEVISVEDKLTEVYGSDFKSSFFAPINEISSVRSVSGEELYSSGFLTLATLVFLILFIISVICALVGDGIPKSVMIFYNIVQVFLLGVVLLRYRKEFLDKSYISKIESTKDFLVNNKLKINV